MTTLRRIHGFVALLFLVMVVPASSYGQAEPKERVPSAEPRQSERRRHFEILGTDGASLYEGTEIVRVGELSEEKLVLVRDNGFGDFVLRWAWDFRRQVVDHRISDVKDRSFLQSSSKSPFTSRTRSETMAEAGRNPSLTRVNALLKLETNGGVWEGMESEWLGDARALRSLRHSLRVSLDPFIMEAIERGRGLLFATTEGEGFFLLVGRYAVYDTSLDKAGAEKSEDPPTLDSKTAAPNCDFDQAFGFPCSDEQKERLKKAAQNRVIPETY